MSERKRGEEVLAHDRVTSASAGKWQNMREQLLQLAASVKPGRLATMLPEELATARPRALRRGLCATGVVRGPGDVRQ